MRMKYIVPSCSDTEISPISICSSIPMEGVCAPGSIKLFFMPFHITMPMPQGEQQLMMPS